MPCYSPLRASRIREADSYRISFTEFDQGEEIRLPCGQCIGCRLERSRQWAVRCLHESKFHDMNCFLTLTFDDAHLGDGSLHKEDFQLFMKRLRKRIDSSAMAKDYPQLYKRKILYYHCGEYGEKFSRPHHHACIFGFDFPDRVLVSTAGPLYHSKMLSELWPFGHHWIGEVTFESAAYVARYCTKKITGRAADKHYQRVDSSGEVFKVLPEYNTMSRRPAIGVKYIEKYSRYILDWDEIWINGRTCRPSRFYDKYLEKFFPDDFDFLRMKREYAADAKKYDDDNTPDRLLDRHECKVLSQENFTRPYEITSKDYSSDVVSSYDRQYIDFKRNCSLV